MKKHKYEPVTFYVLGQAWTFSIVPAKSLTNKKLKMSDRDEKVSFLGVSDGETRTMSISDGVRSHELDETIRHELLHVFVSRHFATNTIYTLESMEELCADIIGVEGLELIRLAECLSNYAHKSLGWERNKTQDDFPQNINEISNIGT